MRVKTKVLLLVALCFRFSECIVFGSKETEKTVKISPMDPTVCVSQNVTFTCSVTGKVTIFDEIVFLESCNSRKPRQDITKINKTSAELTLYDVSLKDDKSLICCAVLMQDCKDCESCDCGLSFVNVIIPGITQPLYSGTLHPLDPDVCLTQNVTFTCILLSQTKPNHTIGFAVKDENTNKEYMAVHQNEINTINKTVAEYTLYNINVTTTNYIYVRCYYWQNYGEIDSSLQLGHTTTASVYSMPKEIEKMNCIVENYIKTLNCSFDYGLEYKHAPTVRFLWRIPNLSASWNNCPNLNTDYGYCYWNTTSVGDFSMKDIEINITILGDCDVDISSNFIIDNTQNIKPDPVVNLESRVINSTCVEVFWNTINSQTQYPKEHRVQLSSKWGDNQEVKFTTNATSESLEHVRTFCDLYSYTQYTFTVSIKPTGDQDGFYSDTRETMATTLAAIPSASPQVVDGGYKGDQRECDLGYKMRQVCSFWEPIREDDKNGPMKGLQVTYTDLRNPNLTVEMDLAEDLTYSCTYIDCDKSYRFSIKARNEIGTSEIPSTMEITSAKSGILKPEFIVEADDNSTGYVTWSYSDEVDVDHFLVVWCRNKNGNCESYSNVNWRRVGWEAREAMLTFNMSHSAQDFLYGVSVITDRGSSGLEWKDCVYLRGAAPKRRPQNVVVSRGSKDNTLVVTFDKLPCNSAEPYIIMYNIQYNEQGHLMSKAMNISASSEARVVLKDLKKGVKYDVTVRGVSEDEHFGPESIIKTGIPDNNDLEKGEIAVIAIGSFTFVLFFGCILAYCIRKCKKSTSMKLKTMQAITIPGGEDNFDFDIKPDLSQEQPKPVERQNSDDSGIYPLTPQPDKVDSLKFQEMIKLPNDYVRAAGDDTHDQMDSNTSHISTISSGEINVTRHLKEFRVGFVLEQNGYIPRADDDVLITPFEETFRKGLDESVTTDKNVLNSDTPVKTRTKTISGDSGVSADYSKATCNKQTANLDDVVDEDVDDESMRFDNQRDHGPLKMTSISSKAMTKSQCSTVGNSPGTEANSYPPDYSIANIASLSPTLQRNDHKVLLNNTGFVDSPIVVMTTRQPACTIPPGSDYVTAPIESESSGLTNQTFMHDQHLLINSTDSITLDSNPELNQASAYIPRDNSYTPHCQPNNQHNLTPSSNQRSDAQGYVSHCNLPHSDSTSYYTSTSTAENSAIDTIFNAENNTPPTNCDGYVSNSNTVPKTAYDARNSPPSRNGSLSNTNVLNTSGYVSSPGSLTTFSSGSTLNESTEQKQLVKADDTENQSTGSLSEANSSFVDQSQFSICQVTPDSGCAIEPPIPLFEPSTPRTGSMYSGYVGETFAKSPNIESSKPSTDSCILSQPMPLTQISKPENNTNGYIDQTFVKTPNIETNVSPADWPTSLTQATTPKPDNNTSGYVDLTFAKTPINEMGKTEQMPLVDKSSQNPLPKIGNNNNGYVDETFAETSNIETNRSPGYICAENQQMPVSQDSVLKSRNNTSGYVDQTFAQNPTKDSNKPSSNQLTSLNHATNSKQGNNTSGYVDQTFAEISIKESASNQCPVLSMTKASNLEPENNNNGYVDQTFAEIQINVNPDSIELSNYNVQDLGQEDSGLSSLEQSSPESERKYEKSQNGYVSHLYAESNRL